MEFRDTEIPFSIQSVIFSEMFAAVCHKIFKSSAFPKWVFQFIKETKYYSSNF